MLNPPKTREEAEKRNYNKWAGNPYGEWYNPKRCAYEAPDASIGLYRQCRRHPGHGPDGLYCKQHARMVK